MGFPLISRICPYGACTSTGTLLPPLRELAKRCGSGACGSSRYGIASQSGAHRAFSLQWPCGIVINTAGGAPVFVIASLLLATAIPNQLPTPPWLAHRVRDGHRRRST